MASVIAIGALGGSGTRAVSQILIEAGIYMGDDLNHPNDNLIFTRLFKNPSWYRNATNEEITKRLNIFNAYMEQDSLDFTSAMEFIKASKNNPTFKKNGMITLKAIRKLLNTPRERSIWGWKEPNTQIYIDEISNYFPDLKYIHIVRHGLDMAFSSNKQQLKNWGYKYDVLLDGKETDDEMAYKQMTYWVRSTEDAIKKGKKLGNRFLLINHSTFCQKPVEHVDRLIQFIGFDINKDELDTLYQIPKTPTTLGRYKNYDLQIFDTWQMDFVRELGFNI